MRRIALTQGHFAFVDDADFEWLNKWKWFAQWSKQTQSYYAVRKEKRLTIRMHAIIAGYPRPDHANGDSLDNRRHNLRPATASQNGANARRSRNNTSGVKGACWSKNARRWRVGITVNRQRIHVGYFSDLETAARAYNEAATKFFGEYARLNAL